MYTLGIPNRQYRRCTQVLGPELADPVSYDIHKQDDGFYMFSFPEVDEYEFKDIVLLLKNNGITTIGADDQLTERNIMKLTDLLKEQESPDENNLLDILKRTLESWEKKEYRGGVEDCEKSDHYFEDIKDIIEDYEEESGADAIAMGADDARDMQEQERGTDAEPKSSETTTKVKLKMSNIEDEVTITEKPGKVLEDVTINWGNESHTVTFEAGDQIEDHGNEGMDIEFMAESDDGKWQFILEVYAEASYPNTDPTEWDWEELIIQDHPDDESHLDPEDRSDYDGPLEEEDVDEGTCGYGKNGKIGKKPAGPDMLQEEKRLLQIRAGIIK
tara:strand:- start:31 stop:1020 length:990 start_codon:yes stop_codon:yes gene_type:complete